MIIATAGHIDHGKTLLIRTLTGVDTDRLPEEKQRGMTIDLGFAYLPVGSDQTIGFIDVPGHERFIRNMLCGITGIDAVLFVIAADDGPMPQTSEHLAILDLLEVRSGVVALTKVDRVPPERVAEVEREIVGQFAETTLAGAKILPVSAVTGVGIEELQEHLKQMACSQRLRTANGNFRMAVDRCFNVVGAGLVVTGTAVSGSLAVGDQVRAKELTVRVRAIHAQNARSDTCQDGQRCALNLAGAGLGKDLIRRGDWIVAAGSPSSISKLDAQIRVLKSERQPFAHWTPVHVHLGAADVTGRVAVLETTNIPPGQSGLVQLILDRPTGALRGDGLIIRDQSARRTIAGGRVIDIFPPARGRAKPERLAYLSAMENTADEAALALLVAQAGNGLNLSKFAGNRNLTPGESAALFARIPIKSVSTKAGLVAFSQLNWDELKARVLESLAAWHRLAPDTVGVAEDRLSLGRPVRLPREALRALLTELVREGTVIKDGAGVRLASHLAKFNGADAALWNKVVQQLDGSPPRPPAVHEIVAAIGEDSTSVESLLGRATRLGLVVQLAKNRFVRPSALRRLGEIAEQLAAEQGVVAVAAFRDRSGIGRNVAVEVLEYFDRIKFTRRSGDAHALLRSAANAFGPSGSTSAQ